MQQNEQELIYKLSIFEQQIQQMQEQIRAVERAVFEMNSLNIDLDELKGKEGKEILAPVGKGIFAKAKLISEELIVGVGGGNMIKKSINETKEMIEKQINKLEEVKVELNNNLEKVGKEVEKLIEGAREKTNIRVEEINN